MKTMKIFIISNTHFGYKKIANDQFSYFYDEVIPFIKEKYKDGDIIFEEGSSGDWIYVVESGAVEISKIMHGEKEVLLELGPGEIIGELGFITKIGVRLIRDGNQLIEVTQQQLEVLKK